MQMLYNSDSFAVVEIDLPARVGDGAQAQPDGVPRRGGYEIVDKFSRKEIFIEGALAESFREGVDALVRTEPSVEELDDYIGRFAGLMQQPMVLH
jgi:hypothetical protein